MIDFSASPFGPTIRIPDDTKVVFVADMFVEDYVGGAELTTQALIDSADVKVFKVHSKDVSMSVLQQGADRFWVFGNATQLDARLLPTIVGNLRYSILEYDYKYCILRSPEKHAATTGKPCDCSQQPHGKLISSFYHGAKALWWMSSRQMQRYLQEFPFLSQNDNVVLSSVFDRGTLDLLKTLRKEPNDRSDEWIVLGSSSWVKGADEALQWCVDNGKRHAVIWNVPYPSLLEQLSSARGFAYLPRGGDTCPRMVIEAKLLGCELHINGNVQHADEPWFATDDPQVTFDHLARAPATFWDATKRAMEQTPSISGYVTAYDCIRQQYPLKQCIDSMLQFCDEVCVVDGGSTDGTWETLEALVATDDRVKAKQVVRDWSSKRHPVFDGMQKAEARKMCTKEFCWQIDADEVVHEDDAQKVREMCARMPKGVELVALPVIEYWGGPDKVRMDVQPWKWRLSRNLPHITHGIPVELRRTDSEGRAYAAVGTDGCDVIDTTTGERVPFVGFYTPAVEEARQRAVSGDPQAQRDYEAWFNDTVASIPCVFHYSWYDLPRKMRLYRDYWQNHWNALWDKDDSDTAENNMMFGVPWSEVTDEMIEARAKLMKERLGGWIWHRQWDGKQATPHIRCTRTQPKVVLPT